jgi:ABC-type cobalamin transport system ATPase subunit
LEQRISDLQSAFGLSSNDRVDEGLVASVERLFSEQTDAEKRLEKCESALSEAILQVADSAASLVSLRDEYTRRFQDLLAGHADPAGNPIVKSSLQDAVCGVCGTASEAVVAEIQRRLDRGRCPLCNSEVRQSDSVTSFAELLAIDKRIQEAQEGYNLACRTKSRAEEERNSASQALISATRQIKQLEQSERDLIARIRDKHLRVGEDPDQISLRALRTDLAGLLATKVVALKERDAKRAELATLQRLLSTRYTSAEELFLPIFRNLAELFLGRPVNIRLRKVSAGLSLLIDVDNAERREAYQLSESQRFFVDVALRMALAQFMSPSGTLAPLYVDTPEGALDIAYEKQAGAMFARFVRSGHNLLMTANVNSSQLLLELAKECRRKLFHLVVMTTWSRLSTVQLEGQALFESSIRAIRSAMNAR